MAQNTRTGDLTSGPMLQKIILFSLPLAASSILQLLFNAADVVVVGRFAGSTALAAVGSNGALINLLVNAAKFTEKGEIMFGYKIRGEELYFYVKDTGIGISLENQKKIFERFTKVNTFIQGTGLGLSICKNIVTKMKGRIGVESEGEGKGSTFWFTIPYKPKEAQKENNLTLMPLLNERSKEKPIILIAEDNESNYMLFKSILQKDYELVHAWDGEEAVELHQKFHPHVVIMDINMPKIDGLEVCRRIRGKVTCPIIFLTAKVEEQDRVNGLLSGGDDYILKPFSLKELDARIIAHLKREERHKGKSEYRFHGDLSIDYGAKRVQIGENDLELTKLEYAIIEFLSMNPGQVFDRERIYEKVCGYDAEGDSRVVTELIRRVRKKLAEYTQTEYIETVWGMGYRWKR